MDHSEEYEDLSRRSVLRTGAAVGIGALGIGAVGAGAADSAAAAPAPPGSAAPDSWKGPGDRITFEPQDFEALDIALHVVPDLRICALAVKLARAEKVRYPITDPTPLVKLLPRSRFVAAGHDITEKAIRAHLPAELFPIRHEGELAERVYIALLRCRAGTAAAARAGKLR
ncbi:hypothetical protein [Amycolatopsis regifaucium]|uniref:Uncharacterized protein n=1 Tax=Amycolatopsis regifaucium TaxID=546365 RepID=A0A154MN03_9PSEU|nr:hypothetical protein [Amycolatopsis regifaucium]KZB85661.1 hypothetical protein AVL48_29835 [Amycolatopsis regifaucium]OKA10585.1 hypothetical protein ATP06_0204075 [Amycolatopsis regifaucium]SFI83092.1 hypothetical protein SAMN04489731_113186 [Amycolatopsis regifaucium]